MLATRHIISRLLCAVFISQALFVKIYVSRIPWVPWIPRNPWITRKISKKVQKSVDISADIPYI
jgi:hypothetical protein